VALNLQLVAPQPATRVSQPISVVGEHVSEDHHRSPVRVASKDVETTEARLRRHADEDPVTGEKEVEPEGRGQEGWAEALRQDEGRRGQTRLAVGIGLEGRGEKRLKRFAGERVGEDEAMAEVSCDRQRIAEAD
jgi:hypothetical protein